MLEDATDDDDGMLEDAPDDDTGCLKKKGDLHMMLVSIVGPVWANMCTEWTQQTLPVVPRHTLGSYFTFCMSLQCPQ